MSQSIFDDMKKYVGFDAKDADAIVSLKPIVAPHFERIVDEFYDVLLQSPGASAVLLVDDGRLHRLRDSLEDWLDTFFSGVYGAEFEEQRNRIGRAHVRVGLPQRYMITGIEILRQCLRRVVEESEDAGQYSAKIPSLDKLLTLELGIMLETYKESYSANLRESERSAVEEQLTRAQHLAQIGQLSASLAHEIKNPLAGISGAIQIIREGLPREHHHYDIIGEVLAQIKRLDNAVKDLLVYSRPAPPKLAACRLNSVIKRMSQMVSDGSDARQADIELDLGDEDPVILADEANIEQLVLNLLLNAAHAAHDCGAVAATTRSRDHHVEFVVKDSGPGMSVETMGRAFEPFFTTKARGTGLGLPICKRIVESHAGRIKIESTPGAGTTVRVQLPLASEASRED